MKKSFYLILLLITLVIFVSCDSEVEEQPPVNIGLNLYTENESSSRALQVEDKANLVDFAGYVYKAIPQFSAENGKDPHGTQRTYANLCSESVNKANLDLAQGKWNITVGHKDTSGNIVYEGTATIDIIKGGVNEFDINLVLAPGKGSISLSVMTPLVSGTGERLKVSYNKIGGSAGIFTGFTESTRTSVNITFTGTISNLDTGYYILAVEFNDGTATSGQVVGCTVMNGRTSAVTGEIPGCRAYVLTWDFNEGTTENTDYTKGEVVFGHAITPPVVTRKGYDFTNWTPVLPATMPPADSTFKALWNARKYNGTFNPNEGTIDGSGNSVIKEQTFDSAWVLPNEPKRNGYVFDGWNTTGTGTKLDTAKWTFDVPTTLKALWQENTITLNILKDGSFWSSSGVNVALYQGGSQKYGYSSATANGSAVTWKKVSEGVYDIFAARNETEKTILADTGIDLTVASNSPSADVDFFTLTLTKSEGIESVSPSSVVAYLKGQEVDINAILEDGYEWKNWTGSETITTQNAKVLITEVKTYTANTTLVTEVTITFVYNGADGNNTLTNKTVTINDTYGTLPEPTRTGFTFKGWFEEPQV